MGQPKRKRRTKHRGNAAGMVEVRGRTGRPVPGASSSGKGGATRARVDRYSHPPTWKSAANRAAIATILFIVVVIVITKQPVATAIGIGMAMFVIYVPIGYYTDNFLYQRRQKSLGKGKV